MNGARFATTICFGVASYLLSVMIIIGEKERLHLHPLALVTIPFIAWILGATCGAIIARCVSE